MIETLTVLIGAIAILAAARWYIKNPITRKAAYLTGATALFLIAVTSLADLITVAMAS
jgi:hypothetical protein